MKIAMVFDGLQVGGIERVGVDYAHMFIEMEYDVTVINLVPELNQMEKELPNECNLVHINYSRNLSPEKYDRLTKMGKAKYVMPFAHLSLVIANTVFKPIVHRKLSENFDIAIAFSGHYNDLAFVAHNMVKSNKKMAWCHGTMYSYGLINTGYFELYNKIKNLVVLSDEGQEYALTCAENLDVNIKKIYNPTYIEGRFVNQNKVDELKEQYGDFVLMVSRFECPPKDPYTLIDAMRGIKKHLVFLGDGPDLDKVKAYAENGRGTGFIHFLGNRDDVQNYYSAAYMLVHSSLFEGLPTILVEAMAFGLPIIATDAKPGSKEILQNNDYGLICKVKDVSGLSACITRYYEDRELYRQYRQKGFERLKDFSPETIQIQMEEAISNLV